MYRFDTSNHTLSPGATRCNLPHTATWTRFVDPGFLTPLAAYSDAHARPAVGHRLLIGSPSAACRLVRRAHFRPRCLRRAPLLAARREVPRCADADQLPGLPPRTVEP